MSKQLTFSATISAIAIALFALSASFGISQDASREIAGTQPLAEITIGR